jgi:hypothetical protein
MSDGVSTRTLFFTELVEKLPFRQVHHEVADNPVFRELSYDPVMMRVAVLVVLLSFALAGTIAVGQNPERTMDDPNFESALRHSTLTNDGEPFHAVLEIIPGKPNGDRSPGIAYKGRVELWWLDGQHYRILLTSPDFHQEKIVSGGQVEETDTGDFLPEWLNTFVRVLLDPVSAQQFRTGDGVSKTGGESGAFTTASCIRRDDRRDGISDELTFGQICLDRSQSKIQSINLFNFFVFMSDWQPFREKEVARKYETFVRDQEPITGELLTLEGLSEADKTAIVVKAPTLLQNIIETDFVSTSKEESLIDKAPTIVWPAVREGKTDGYMIVYARTDRTGQVRETATHNSDNLGLQGYGMQQALGYKFKPLVVDGVAKQMEMPLVLHFSSRIENALPILDLEAMKRQTIICHPDAIPAGVLQKGESAIVRVSVDESGAVTNVQPSSQAPWGRMVGTWMSVKRCQFRPYSPQGKPTSYKGEIELRP